MRKLSLVILSFFLLLVSIPAAKAQSGSQISMTDVLVDRFNKLENVCGEWVGTIGSETVRAEFLMEESSSAIGEMHKKDQVFFLHCFAEDMVMTDEYEVGGADGYDYCIYQQSEGELVSVLYLSMRNDVLKGIHINGTEQSSVVLVRRGSGNQDHVKLPEADYVETFETDKWNNVSYLNTVEAYESYLADFPQGRYADEARKNIESIKAAEIKERLLKEDLAFWEKAVAENTAASYNEYLASDLQDKHYEDEARGRIEILAAEEADRTGDYDVVLASLERAAGYVTLSDELIAMRDRNMEQRSYERYLNADGDLQTISRGIEFVNTYLKSEKRNEVSDRVAYLMASSPNYLAGTPVDVMLSYAKTEKTKEYVVKACKKAARKRYTKSSNGSNLGFNFGIGAAVNNPLEAFAPVYGGHFLFSVGDNRNFFNFEFGARYGYWSFVNKEDASDKFDFHQLRLVVAPKFNLIRQKKSAFYLYVAPEAAYGYPIDPHATRDYEANTLSFGGRVGVGYGHFDLSASYMMDYWPMVKDTFTATYYPTMVGVALTIYLSGSGR